MTENNEVKSEEQLFKTKLNSNQAATNSIANKKLTKPNSIIAHNASQGQQVKIQNLKNTGVTSIPLSQTNYEVQSTLSNKVVKRSAKKVSLPCQEQKKQVYREIKWFCPCGEKMLGPFHFFQHIKDKHKSDFLQKVVKQETVKTFIRNYPQNTSLDYQMIESMDQINFESEINKMSLKYSEKDFTCEDTVPVSQHRGTYADLARKFFQQFGRHRIDQLLLSQFFQFLQHFIQRRYGKDYWQQQSPKDIIKMSNHLYHYFRAVSRISKNEFGPLRVQDIKTLIYMLAKWMFMNKWTNDRLIDIQNEADGQESNHGNFVKPQQTEKITIKDSNNTENIEQIYSAPIESQSSSN